MVVCANEAEFSTSVWVPPSNTRGHVRLAELTCERNSLIMLLIFSDFFKASWQLIYPAVVFTRGAVASGSRFCQAAGFFMSMGIEASGRYFRVTKRLNTEANVLPQILQSWS